MLFLKWRRLADDFNVRDLRKLYQLARQRDLDVTQAMAFEALKADVGRQAQAQAAVEPLQNKNAETVGRATKATQELTGDDKNFVVTTDLGNEFATLDRELPKPCAGRSGPRTATALPWWTGASRR